MFRPRRSPRSLAALWKRSSVLLCCLVLPAAGQAPLPDVLTGQRYLKQTQDLSFASVYKSSIGAYYIDVLTFNTANSQISSSTPTTQQTIAGTVELPSTNNLPNPAPVAVATGRMFDTSNDQFAAIAPTDNWAFTYYNPANGVLKSMSVSGSGAVLFGGNITPSTWAVTGDFLGDGLKETVGVFASYDGVSTFNMGMAVMGQQPNANGVPATDAVMTGPGYYVSATNVQPSNIISFGQNTVATGDFNGDGRDEIAVLMNDQQTVRFYSVNSSYTISPMSPASITLPQPVYRAALVAGRFVVANRIDLVVMGVSGYSSTLLFPYINTQSQNQGQFNPQVETPANPPTQPSFAGGLYGFFAQAVPLILPGTQPTTFGTEQLVFASQNYTGEESFWIGDFLVNQYAFTQLSYSDFGPASIPFPNLIPLTCTLGMQVGNFDNQTSSGTYNSAPQVAFLFNNGSCNGTSSPYLLIQNIVVPQNLSSAFSSDSWLTVTSGTSTSPTGNVTGTPAPTTLLFNVSDVEGRSQRLGAPQIVVIPSQTQPEVVLPLPPMQADYVVPPDASECAPNTLDDSGACVAGITYSPTTANSKIPPFANQFIMDTSSSQQTSNTATSSWGLSVKTSIGVNVSFDDLESSGSASFSDTAKSTFEQKVSNQTINSSSYSTDVTAQTITADILFFSQRDLYVYYYPVLGAKDSKGNPIYVNFSVPSNLYHFPAADATQYDWYQPVQEPGNVLSYPSSLNQLAQGFANGLDLQTSTEFGCQSVGSAETSFATSWKNNSSNSQSVGSAATFSNEASMSASAGAGITGIDGVSVSESLSIGTSTSLSSLNVETSTIASGEGVKDTSPGFPNLNGWNYYVAQYIWGQKPPANTSVWQQITFPSTYGQTTTGPLFVGFVADVAPANPGGACVNNSTPPAWGATYTLPDIGLNHPKRWHWSTASSSVSFNYPNGTNSPTPATQSTSVNPFIAPFYWMKGFFITTPNASLSGPNLSRATAGQPVQLTARVYNFSLKDTDDPTLQKPASRIHVDFYGQQVQNSNIVPGTLFEIGEQILTQPIPGFKSINYSGQPNWITASVPFDTTGRAGQNLVFWVITWMEDSNGALVNEMRGHGLVQTPAQNLTNLLNPSQLFMENYSNNVGLYGVHTPFAIVPPSTPSSTLPGASAPRQAGALQSVRLQGPSTALLDDDVRLNSRIRASGGPVDNITISYYDGKRGKGSLIDTQLVHHVDAEDVYVHGTSFQPRSCGVHDIYVEASNGKSAVTSHSFKLNVTVDPLALIDEMLYRLRAMKLANRYKTPLLLNLRLPRSLYRLGDERSARLALRSFGRSADLTADAAGPTTRTRLAAMAGEANTIIGCEKESASERVVN